jgi:hypothetical protein
MVRWGSLKECTYVKCDYLVPDNFGPGVPLYGGDDGECLLREGHDGEHLVKTKRGYYLWQFQEDFCVDSEGAVCDCDYIECYAYRVIPDSEAQKILAEHGAGTD